MATTLRSGLANLAERITTPLLPSDYLDVINPMLSAAQLRGRIVAITPETRDSVTVLIKPGRGWHSHIPGQYVRLGVEVNGVRHWRTYSLTSRTDDRFLAITVKSVAGGIVSNHLVHDTKVGTVVHLEQAAGDFIVDTAPEKVLFLTAGSGITPVMGMLRNAAAGKADIVVVHSAPTADEVIFGAELRAMADRGDIRLAEIHTRADGRLDMARLRALVGDLDEREVWACGPSGLLDMAEIHCSAEKLHTERFRTEVIVTGEGGTVTFSGTGTVTQGAGDQSLLDAGEAAGVLMPSGCRMGVCFGCVAPLRHGAVRDLRNGALTTAGDDVVVQTCISAAAGDCDIAL